MFMLYLLAENTREFEILTKDTRGRDPDAPQADQARHMCNNESVWMVPGTVSAED
jgi:hypothetical protein